ncbi:MAG: hypothetical protein FWG28_02580 [Clostridiales bacterium]|nr:hypothetical protein [Clostridiales bacterium]
MLWKDRLSIGNDTIDGQHRALFERAEELLGKINDSLESNKESCISAIRFLKDYTVFHFGIEETYQESIGYPDFKAHQKLHQGFINTILEHEQKMTGSDFAEKDVKDFSGMLVAWLLYHVADIDQGIGRFARNAGLEPQVAVPHTHSEIIRQSVFNVLHKMAGLDMGAMKQVESHDEGFENSVAIEMLLSGGVSGFITFVYPVAFINNLIYQMMDFEPEAIDELELSALFEVSNITCKTICEQIEAEKGVLCVIEPPFMTSRLDINPDERIALDTGIGIVEADIVIEYA